LLAVTDAEHKDYANLEKALADIEKVLPEVSLPTLQHETLTKHNRLTT